MEKISQNKRYYRNMHTTIALFFPVFSFRRINYLYPAITMMKSDFRFLNSDNADLTVFHYVSSDVVFSIDESQSESDV